MSPGDYMNVNALERAPARRPLTATTSLRALVLSRGPLALVLVLQAALSARLIWSNTAFQDEALYLWAGRVEWAHWLHGARIPPLGGYFSGAPVFYPPLAAAADWVAGLAGARLLSLLFMLITTTLLHGVTQRIFDRRAAFYAAALFAGLGSVQFLGALATYDAQALMLLALATWLGLVAATAAPRRQVWFLLLSALALLLADVAKYAALLFDPVVIATVSLYMGSLRGRSAAARTLALLCVSLAAGLFAAVQVGGSTYWTGITNTTLSRQAGSSPSTLVVYLGCIWIAAIVVLALIGAAVLWSRRGDWMTRLLAVSLAVAVFLAPLSQARMHVIVSLFKHAAFGAWFGAILAGFALAWLVNAAPAISKRAARVLSVAAVTAAAVPGIALANSHFTRGWPDTARYIAALRPIVARDPGPILVDGGDVSIVEYYMPHIAPWWLADRADFFSYRVPRTDTVLSGNAALNNAIRTRYFRVITMATAGSNYVDSPIITRDIRRFRDYRLVDTVTTPPRATKFLIYAAQPAAKHR